MVQDVHVRCGLIFSADAARDVHLVTCDRAAQVQQQPQGNYKGKQRDNRQHKQTQVDLRRVTYTSHTN